MRFSEKSFEIRFCAALSAAIMPFNRNPQWFGLTQAQERRAGIDAMLRQGGKLLVFQFKAKDQSGSFKVERDQAMALDSFTNRHRNSTYYVFAELDTTLEASKQTCIFKQSWLCPSNHVAKLFNGNSYATRSLTNYNSFRHLPWKLACGTLGHFCTLDKMSIEGQSQDGFISFLVDGYGPISGEQPLPRFTESLLGIPIGSEEASDEQEGQPISSIEDFERALGEFDRRSSWPGLMGLFLPHPRSRRP